MSRRILIYGATGYSGSLTAHALVREGHDIIVAGRNIERTQRLARALGVSWTVVDLANRKPLERAIARSHVLINAAGPFSGTARSLVKACMRKGVHYLDICGEAPVVAWILERQAAALKGGVMLMPCAGLEVVVADCLVARLVEELPDTHALDIALKVPYKLSKGSMASMIEQAGRPIFIRRQGQLKATSFGRIQREFNFAGEKKICVAVSWPDVITAYITSHVSNITSYLDTGALLRMARNVSELLALGAGGESGELWTALAVRLSDTFRPGRGETGQSVVVVEASSLQGKLKRLTAITDEPYTFTANAVAHIASMVVDGWMDPGFQTPSRVFGSELIDRIGGVCVSG